MKAGFHFGILSCGCYRKKPNREITVIVHSLSFFLSLSLSLSLSLPLSLSLYLSLSLFLSLSLILSLSLSRSLSFSLSSISETHRRLNRSLFNQTKQDRTHIFRRILFFKTTNNEKTNKSLSCCSLGASRFFSEKGSGTPRK